MNKVIKYNLVKTQPTGLGWCAYHWNNRDNYRNDANEYKTLAENINAEIQSLKSGKEQLELENLRERYNELLNEKTLKTHKLRQLKLKTLAWQKEPQLHYSTYKTNGVNDVAGMGGWLLNDVFGCSDGKAAEREWQAKRLEEKEKFDRLSEQKENILRDRRVNKIALDNEIESVRIDIKKLDAEIISELQKQRDIMLAYETKKRAEELGTDQEADDRKRNLLEEARLAKENKEKERKKLIIGLSFIAAFGIIALKKKKNKKK